MIFHHHSTIEMQQITRLLRSGGAETIVCCKINLGICSFKDDIMLQHFVIMFSIVYNTNPVYKSILTSVLVPRL